MKLPKSAQKSIEALTELLEVGKPTVVKTEDIAKAGGVSPTDVNRARRFLEYLGLMKFTIDRSIGGKDHISVTATFTLLKPRDEVWKTVNDYAEYNSFALWRAHKGGEKALADKLAKLPTDLIDTPEPEKPFAVIAPLRKSEPKALIEAARQYQHRWEVGRQHAQALYAEGLIGNVNEFLRGLDLAQDSELETVAKVIPLIEEFEKTITNLEKFQQPLREKAARVEPLEREIRMLKEQNVRLIAGRTATVEAAER